jgi:glutamate decarboxylase
MHKQVPANDPDANDAITPTYASRFLEEPIDKYTIPENSLEPSVAYQVIKDEIQLDGNAHMNLATFVTTWMEPQASQLMAETFEKNLIDKDEYPQTAELERRCVSIFAKLWNAPQEGSAIGTSTVGSSEACMLAGMALKWRWRAMREHNGKPIDRPNLVLGSNAQICWEKFCRYWDVEPRFIPMEEGRYHLDPQLAAEACDEHTIGVVAILGSTLDGSYEPVQALSAALDHLHETTGLDIPIHVDAASGGCVAPFIQPELVWDFRLLRVKSINTSGHKYGMVYPGVGWIVWRHPDDLPKELVFNVNYLGGEMPTFTLNFSKPGNGVIAQYYNFLRLGKSGYRRILRHCHDTALYLSTQIAALGPFELLSKGDELPVFAFRLRPDVSTFSLYDLSERLRAEGWQVPVYTLAKNLEHTTVMRVVIKENFSRDMAELLVEGIQRQLKLFNEGSIKPSSIKRQSFHH